MPGIEGLVFIIAALLVGGLSMGGITLVYFADKWRDEPSEGHAPVERASKHLTQLDRSV